MIYTAHASDVNPITYSLENIGDYNFLSIDVDSGTVSLTVNPDYETKSSYSFSVKATDTFGNYANQNIILNISNVEEYTSPVQGQEIIDLGMYGKLIKPVNILGHYFYYWDRSGDGTSNDNPPSGLNLGFDAMSHNTLDLIFNEDYYGVKTNGDTTDTYRYTNINGDKLALATITDLQDIFQTYGIPEGWKNPGNYWSATPSTGTYGAVHYAYNADDTPGVMGDTIETMAMKVILEYIWW